MLLEEDWSKEGDLLWDIGTKGKYKVEDADNPCPYPTLPYPKDKIILEEFEGCGFLRVTTESNKQKSKSNLTSD